MALTTARDCKVLALFFSYLYQYLPEWEKIHENFFWKIFFEMPPSRNLLIDLFRNYDSIKAKGEILRDEQKCNILQLSCRQLSYKLMDKIHLYFARLWRASSG